jgi:hypothetical protein
VVWTEEVHNALKVLSSKFAQLNNTRVIVHKNYDTLLLCRILAAPTSILAKLVLP